MSLSMIQVVSSRASLVLPVALAIAVAAAPAVARGATPIRGDSDSNGRLELTDAIFSLSFLFLGGRGPACTPIADSNGDGTLNLSDAIHLLSYLFLGGPEPGPLSQGELNECLGIDPEAVARGMKEYESADPDGNFFSCATCHSMSPDSESDVIRPGHSLLNSLGRPSYKGAAFGGPGLESYVSAANVCRNDWMAISSSTPPFDFVPWTVEAPRFTDLVAFMKSLQTRDSEPALDIQIVAPARTGPPPASASGERGCELFNRSCMVCHGVGAVGNQIAPSLVEQLPLCENDPNLCRRKDPVTSACFEITQACLDDPDYVRYRIRLSGPDHPDQVYKVPPGFQLAGSVMPFWTADKLSDDQVEDLVAFVALARQAFREGKPTFDCTQEPPAEGKVLRRGSFVRLFHNVSGVAEELDTRKIRLRDFNYDGGGISVKVWLYSSAGNIRGGRAIGPDLFGQPQTNATLVIDIPADLPSDQFDSVSIWCVSAKQDFGHALLEAVP
ncbi:MAG: DM13 domain-containing protein [Planctomycetes bacterium]|nr:DM13 domain-containing protein [Planctomycetota bacterium]